jgi:hypothetical protein
LAVRQKASATDKTIKVFIIYTPSIFCLTTTY